MTLDPEKVKAYFSQKSKEREVIRIKADQLVLPNDWVLLVETWKKAADSLPDELPQKPYILKLLGAAEYAIERGDESDFRLWILKARMNFENAKHDKWLMGVQRQFGKDADHRKQQVEEERHPVWQQWQKEADKIRSESITKLSKTEVARRIKKRLSVSESERTIRLRIT
ncbi:hypothetical protein [Marinobacter zhanjiangensis]|uniref:Uncharacterized protein n=1 Tax=Marinobacter zhanjiangensis TaxID=578215 RepID=A0ABQ3BC77_9GAMM|nr:hypothetical protein [Marinobacter zhanjiangensis]GGY85365.1 hypothetical protein GCM10007071_35860 [Marinobacter zhanjiangensis]